MNHSKKKNNRYLNVKVTPKLFRFFRIAPFILAIMILLNFVLKNLQYEASKPILQKFDESSGVMYYYDKDSGELFTGKASWILRYGNQKFEGSYKNGQLHGKSKIWYENGILAEETTYENGVIIFKKAWDRNGIKIIETE